MTAARRLAAIFATNLAGYSRLMWEDEQGMSQRRKTIRSELIDPKIAAHHDCIVKTTVGFT
jgi:adenylate cyclase